MFRANRLVLTGALLILLSVTSASSFAAVRGDVDPKTGMRFPPRAGAFERKGRIEYDDARYEYAAVLTQRRRYFHALKEAQLLLRRAPGNPEWQLLYAKACDGLGEYQEALRIYQQLLAAAPRNAHSPPDSARKAPASPGAAPPPRGSD